ncbi:MAG TPA: MoaD/ThiS family protein [Methylomirabilota bacterium]|jgi:molybdopterin converting factor small subunit|nr:MoaD/ThiS family protein [Methylomirabilota bacterium]
MAVQIYIPTPFRRATANQDRVELEAPDVKALLDALENRFEGLRGLIRNEAGEVHHHVNVYVNGEEISRLQGQATLLRAGDEVSIIPALAGGAGRAGRR